MHAPGVLAADALPHDAPPADNVVVAPYAVVGKPYQLRVSAQGGVPPHRFSVMVGNPHAFGLTLTDEGMLTGVPKAAGTLEFTVSVRDAQGLQAASQAYRIRILVAPVRTAASAAN